MNINKVEKGDRNLKAFPPGRDKNRIASFYKINNVLN